MNNFASWSNLIWPILGLQMAMARKSRKKSTLELTKSKSQRKIKTKIPLDKNIKLQATFVYKVYLESF